MVARTTVRSSPVLYQTPRRAASGGFVLLNGRNRVGCRFRIVRRRAAGRHDIIAAVGGTPLDTSHFLKGAPMRKHPLFWSALLAGAMLVGCGEDDTNKPA